MIVSVAADLSPLVFEFKMTIGRKSAAEDKKSQIRLNSNSLNMSEPPATSAAPDLAARRPIKARQSRWAPRVATWLATHSVTPNQISLGSIGFAILAAIGLLGPLRHPEPTSTIFHMIVAIVGIQGRLLCNLFDGLVAVEGSKAGKCGEIYNDFPDRIADPIILIAAGYAAGTYGIPLGWLAALLAILTAYTRVLGRSIGAGIYFAGPMAKQHRMAVMTAACVAAAIASFWQQQAICFLVALIAIDLGCVVTIARRLKFIARDLEAK